MPKCWILSVINENEKLHDTLLNCLESFDCKLATGTFILQLKETSINVVMDAYRL